MIVKDFLNALKIRNQNAKIRLNEIYGHSASSVHIHDYGVYIGYEWGMRFGLTVRDVIQQLSGVNEELPVYIPEDVDSVEECIRVSTDLAHKNYVLLETKYD